MQLFSPGMSAIHRAGLGGLAATLKTLERDYENGSVKPKELPGPFVDDEIPWTIEPQSITLKFGKPEYAKSYLQKLFEYAFQVRKDGLIYLPGTFAQLPSAAILTDLQLGLTLTFLQHGKVRQLEKEGTTTNFDVEGTGIPAVTVEYRKCSGFKHQKGWQSLVDKQGCLSYKPVQVDGPISPGSVVRHVKYTGQTAAEDPVERMLPLYFALIGCLPLAVNRGVANLVVPEVHDLENFVYDRQAMTPSGVKESVIANGSDAALRVQLKLSMDATRKSSIHLQSTRAIDGTDVPGCHVMTFTPTPWASQQKSRVATIHVEPQDRKTLERFELALNHLPPRIAVRKVKESTGRGKQKKTVEREEAFRTDSVVRPLIAENLAKNNKWYAGFVLLMVKNNPANDRPFRNQLTFERKGLNDMISNPKMWDDEGEQLVVRAVHEAIRQSLGKIREETDGKSSKVLSQATKNRWQRFREKLRLDLAGAKTESQLRFALSDLFSRGGSNIFLRENWEKVLPVLRTDWQLARDLGLLALASYAGRGQDNDIDDAIINESTDN